MFRREQSPARALLTAIIVTISVQASGQTETILGSVVDGKGRPLSGVAVELRRPVDQSAIEQDTTDNEGNFSISAGNLRIGYELHFKRTGYDDLVLPITAQQLVIAKIKVAMARTQRMAETVPRSSGSAAKQPTPRYEVMSDKRKRAIEIYNEAVIKFEDKEDEEAKKAAEIMFREAASIDPTFEPVHRILLTLAVKRQSWVEVSRWAEDLLRITPNDNETIRILYMSLVISQNPVRIGDAAKRLITTDPDTVDAIEGHAHEFFTNNNLAMAQALFKALSEVAPDSPNAYLNLGVCNAKLGDVEATRAAFTTFLELAPEDHPDRQAVEQDLAKLAIPEAPE